MPHVYVQRIREPAMMQRANHDADRMQYARQLLPSSINSARQAEKQILTMSSMPRVHESSKMCSTISALLGSRGAPVWARLQAHKRAVPFWPSHTLLGASLHQQNACFQARSCHKIFKLDNTSTHRTYYIPGCRAEEYAPTDLSAGEAYQTLAARLSPQTGC